MQEKPTTVIDPVCGMRVDVASAERDGLTVELDGRTYAFCRGGCRRAFLEEPAVYVTRAEESGRVAAAAVAAAGGMAGAGGAAAAVLPEIDEGFRRWYESCACCLGDAYPEIKAKLDAEHAAASAQPVGPGICEEAGG